jgi:predicted Ser/Thr protein kinase
VTSPPAIDPERLRALFDELSDLPPAEADRRLACDLADEPALQHALQRLLQQDRQSPDLGPLAPLPPRPTEDAAPNRDVSAAQPAADDTDHANAPIRLGRFHVVRPLGRGGMGVVYDAYDDVLDRRVALKLLTGSTSQHPLLLREARALARLAHPNVVPIYEVGEHNGRPFIAMERVEGQPLSSWLDHANTPITDKLRLLLQAGQALAAAHAAGVIHRDTTRKNKLCSLAGHKATHRRRTDHAHALHTHSPH